MMAYPTGEYFEGWTSKFDDILPDYCEETKNDNQYDNKATNHNTNNGAFC